jgi:hypothetical protein
MARASAQDFKSSIMRAATRKNYLDPKLYEQLYNQLTTVMIVAGLLTAGTYQAVYTGYADNSSDFPLDVTGLGTFSSPSTFRPNFTVAHSNSSTGSSSGHRQFAWFVALNHLAFVCSVVAVFVAVSGVVLLQQLQQWPLDCQKLPAAPKEISTKYVKAEEFGKLEVHARALNFVWHAHNHGVVQYGMQITIEAIFIFMWFALLLAALLSLAAASDALHKHLGGFHSLFFRLVVIGSGAVAVVLSVVPIVVARFGGRRAVASPASVAVISDGTYNVAAASNIRGKEWDAAIRLAVEDPFLLSKICLGDRIWYHAATVVERSENKKLSFHKASGKLHGSINFAAHQWNHTRHAHAVRHTIATSRHAAHLYPETLGNCVPQRKATCKCGQEGCAYLGHCPPTAHGCMIVPQPSKYHLGRVHCCQQHPAHGASTEPALT